MVLLQQIGGKALRARAPRGLHDQHVRQIRRVLPGLVAFEARQLGQRALAVAARDDPLEARRLQRGGQHVPVVEELVSPAVKRAVDAHAVQPRLRFRKRGAVVVREDHPVQVRRGQPQDAVRRQNSPALPQEREPVVEREVLQKMLGVDRRHVLEREAASNVQHLVHAGQPLVVDVDPARDRLLSAADVERRGGPRDGSGRGPRFPKSAMSARVFTTVPRRRSPGPRRRRRGLAKLGF